MNHFNDCYFVLCHWAPTRRELRLNGGIHICSTSISSILLSVSHASLSTVSQLWALNIFLCSWQRLLLTYKFVWFLIYRYITIYIPQFECKQSDTNADFIQVQCYDAQYFLWLLQNSFKQSILMMHL